MERRIDGEPGQRLHGQDSFPFKVHEMLDDVDAHGLSYIVSWQPHGRCFVVHNRPLFVNHVLQLYFKMSKFSSFQRQLNLYNFNRITTGRDKRGYYHELFLRGRRDLCQNIQRQQVKGNGVRQPTLPGKEPNFYLMDFMPLSSQVQRDSIKAPITDVVVSSVSSVATASDSGALPSMLLPFALPSLAHPPPAQQRFASIQLPRLPESQFPISSQLTQHQTCAAILPTPHYLHNLLATLQTANSNTFLGNGVDACRNADACWPQMERALEQAPISLAASKPTAGDALTARHSKLSTISALGYNEDLLDELEPGDDTLTDLSHVVESSDHKHQFHHQESDEMFDAVLRVLRG